MTQAASPPLSDVQEEVLCLIGHDEAGCIPRELQREVDALFCAGLITYEAERTLLTAAGRAAFDRLLLD